MATVSGYPYFELEFGKDGSLVSADQVQQVIKFFNSDAGKGITDVLVFSHGWNNDEKEARDLFNRFLATLQSSVNKGNVPGAKVHSFAFVGVLWPSKRFADADLIPGGAAGIDDGNAGTALTEQHAHLVDTLSSNAAKQAMQKAAGLVNQLGTLDARQAWVDCLRQAVKTTDEAEPDSMNLFFNASAEELFEKLNNPALPFIPPLGGGGGGAGFGGIGGPASAAPGSGSAAGFGALLSGIKGAALRILNYTTYYIMKNRAGVVGTIGLNPALQQIQAAVPDKMKPLFHLLGHSFGARLATATANGPATLRIQTLVLLQGAYSHFGMATAYDGNNDHNGLFRDVVKQSKVAGPILITHSVHDLPVGIAYAIASRIAGQIAAGVGVGAGSGAGSAAGLGGPSDPYGGLGRNGAQKTDNSQFLTLQFGQPNYSFQPHVANNLNGDNLITGHSDICKEEIASAFLRAIA